MGDLAKRIIKEIRSANSPEDLDSVAYIAGDLLARIASPNYHSGIPEIDAESLDDSECLAIKNAVIEALDRNSHPRFVAILLNVLSRTRDTSLRSRYTSILAEYVTALKDANAVVFAATTALAEIDEPLFPESCGYSRNLADLNENLKRADRYLTYCGKPISPM